MIKFFRKIRQKLLTENKFSKYLIYALGEILLVVIGILIALQINNANTERVNRVELDSYLLKISHNIDQDIKVIKRLKIRRDSVYIKSKKSAKLLMNEEITNFEEMIGGVICFYEFYFNSNKSGYEALKNSQYLGRIKNTVIDSLLTSYYAMVLRIEKSEISYNTFIESMEVELNLISDYTPMYEFIQSREYPEDHEIDFKSPEWIKKNQEELRPFLMSNPFKAAVFRSALQNGHLTSYPRLIKTGEACVNEIRKGARTN